MQFEYQDPSPRFDHSKVKGPVAKLIRVRDVSTATGLEVTAGSKVTQIHMWYCTFVCISPPPKLLCIVYNACLS